MNRTVNVIAHHCTGSLLAVLVLVHGLVAVPLLVECIDSHGRTLTEIAGHDACHDHSRGVDPERIRNLPAPARRQYGQWHDPCLDLSLYKPAVAQCGFDPRPLPETKAQAVPPTASCAPPWRPALPTADPPWHSPPGPHRPLSNSLRI